MPKPEVPSPNRILCERIRFVASATLIMLVVGWIGWFYPYDDLLDQSGTPLGADFAMFYVSGQMVVDGAGDQLYDQAEHQHRLHQLFPDIDASFALPYRYPPCVATLMAPLAMLPYALAYAFFLVLSGVAWWTAVRQLVGTLPELQQAWRKSLNWAIFGWPVALETLIGGQASMFALLIAVTVYALLRHQQLVYAGAVLGLAAYKPNVLALLALGCLIRYPRMLRGFVPVALGVGLLCLVPHGWAGVLEYGELTVGLATQSWDVATPFWKVHGLLPWFAALSGQEGRLVCGLIGVGVTVALAVRARSDASGQSIEPIWFAILISMNVLFNAYAPIYDLVLLLAGAALTAEHLAERHGPNVAGSLLSVQLLLAIVYFGPHLSQAIARGCGGQPFSLALAAIAVWQGSLFLQRGREPALHSHQLLTSVSGR